MLANIYEYDDSTRLTFHIKQSPTVSPLAKTAYLTIAQIDFSLKFQFFLSNVEI